MKGWLGRAVANTVLRGEQPRNRIARWSRWFPITPTVDEARFQGPDEPYPRHWRRFPRPWRSIEPGDPVVRDTLASGIEDLPRRWREVVVARDVQGHGAAEVSEQQGVTPEEQRAILNCARGVLRERLARRVAGDDA
jgi:RNA polymerase sigma-70 factor (ECF subfamily)